MARKKKNISRERIIAEIRTAAEELGRPPRRLEFAVRTGISEHFLCKHFQRWNDALKEAEQPIYYRAVRHDGEAMEDWGRVARKLSKVPARIDYEREGRFGAGTFNKRFGNWGDVPRLFRDFAATRPQWTDVVQIIEAKEQKLRRRWSLHEESAGGAGADGVSAPVWSGAADCVASGDPIEFENVRNAPINESGVVFLFALLSRRMGYVIEGIQSRFPDCEAKQKCEDGKWRRVRIEFEYESLNFVRHGHAADGCDVIVCWRHNWAECPVKVIELSKEICKAGEGAKRQIFKGPKGQIEKSGARNSECGARGRRKERRNFRSGCEKRPEKPGVRGDGAATPVQRGRRRSR